MARRVFPRSAANHERKAAEILRQHAQLSAQPISLPIPIELIVEQTYELSVVYDIIREPGGTMILGALDPRRRTIVMNEAHLELFEEIIGPDRFTLAHELAHWVYDADDPNQMSFEFPDTETQVFCLDRGATALPEGDRIREMNANKLAAALLLPTELVMKEAPRLAGADLRRLAQTWGVSHQTLTIRLDELKLDHLG